MSDQQKTLWDDQPPYDSTSIFNKQFRTYIPAGDYGPGCKAFNRLCTIPENMPHLADGRKFSIREWYPIGDIKPVLYGIVEVNIVSGILSDEGISDGYPPLGNQLILAPEHPIDFQDGRFLYIKKWSPRGLKEGEMVIIDVFGYIQERGL